MKHPDARYPDEIEADRQRDNTAPSGGRSAADCSGVGKFVFLVEETSEDAVFCFLSAISAFGVETMEHAQQVYIGDADVRRWVEASYRLIPQNGLHHPSGGDAEFNKKRPSGLGA